MIIPEEIMTISERVYEQIGRLDDVFDRVKEKFKEKRHTIMATLEDFMVNETVMYEGRRCKVDGIDDTSGDIYVYLISEDDNWEEEVLLCDLYEEK